MRSLLKMSRTYMYIRRKGGGGSRGVGSSSVVCEKLRKWVVMKMVDVVKVVGRVVVVVVVFVVVIFVVYCSGKDRQM